ncbi:nucleotidyltransferase family protein [Brevundimonas sp. R86498]|uniref:nucleotidyltransferase family protein n=1 Tax=Brevundimonas sp. R86498 TaxID=3093845 RepID=UPI0037C9578B
MRRDEALAVLRGLEQELRAQGLAHLYIFGSVARDEATASSDVDMAFDLIPGAKFDAFDHGRIHMDLADALGSPVDLIERQMISSRLAQDIEGDLLQVF